MKEYNFGVEQKPVERRELPENPQGGAVKKFFLTLLVIIIAAGLVFGLYGIWNNVYGKIIPKYSPKVWQVVFLTNGQAYFGHVTNVDKHTVTLRNIYYIQVITRPLQTSQPPGVSQQTEQQLTMIKLGNEIHGPVDEMHINRDHVILIENLQSDSKVVDAISRYIEEQKKLQEEKKQ